MVRVKRGILDIRHNTDKCNGIEMMAYVMNRAPTLSDSDFSSAEIHKKVGSVNISVMKYLP
jgi:hypothetical protein